MSTRGFVGYKFGKKIKGWYNHSDSYPGYLGEQVIEKYVTMTQAQLQEFFLKKLSLKKEEDHYGNHHGFMDADWINGKDFVLQDGETFYKDGLFCEYSYIFDLDSKKKRLMFFMGFGKKPCKGYETWFYQSQCAEEKHYVTYKGAIKGDLLPILARVQMYLRYGKGVSKEDKDDATKLLELINTYEASDLPLILPQIQEAKDKVVKEYYEYRIKSISTPDTRLVLA